MRKEILEKIHQGHQGINKCLARACESFWWPGIAGQIKQLVQRCDIYVQEAQENVESLLTTDSPARPWQMVGAGLFQ